MNNEPDTLTNPLWHPKAFLMLDRLNEHVVKVAHTLTLESALYSGDWTGIKQLLPSPLMLRVIKGEQAVVSSAHQLSVDLFSAPVYTLTHKVAHADFFFSFMLLAYLDSTSLINHCLYKDWRRGFLARSSTDLKTIETRSHKIWLILSTHSLPTQKVFKIWWTFITVMVFFILKFNWSSKI